MFHFERTLCRTWAFRQLVFTLTRNVITGALFLMTPFTEMSISPAEPLGYVTAEFTFVFYEIGSVFGAGFYTSTNGDGGALSADQFFFLECGVIVTSLIACFSTTIVRLIAFETLIIRQGTHGELLQVVVIWVTHFLQSWFLVQIFELCSFHGFFDNDRLELNTFLNFFFE